MLSKNELLVSVGRVGGKMHLEDISLGIITDKALPKLMEAAVKGKVFKKVEIHGTATYGDAGEQVLPGARAGERPDHELSARRSRQQCSDRRSQPVAELREVQERVHLL